MTSFLFISLLALTSIFVCNPPAIAGNDGHGAAAIVCRDPVAHTIIPGSVEVLDLKEAVKIYGLTISPDPSASEQQIQKVAARLALYDPYLSKLFQDDVWAAKLAIQFSATALPLLPEYSMPPSSLGLPPECGIEQLALYYDRGGANGKDLMVVDSEIYGQLDNQNTAALFTHEVVYKLNRETNKVDRSVEARAMTGYLMADQFDLARFQTIAQRKLPSPVADELAANPAQIQLLSGSPVVVKLHCNGFFLSSHSAGWANIASPTGVSIKTMSCGDVLNGPVTDLKTIPGSGHDMDYIQINADHGDWIEFYQNDRKLQDSKGKNHFNLKEWNETYHFVLMPIKN